MLKTLERSNTVNRNENRRWENREIRQPERWERIEKRNTERREQRETRQPERYDESFDHDVIYFVDSNLRKMKEEIMDNNMSGKKVMCYKLDQIDEVLQNSTITRQPKFVLIHCGTNHLNYETESTKELEEQYKKTLKLVAQKFPAAKITLSSLLPRKEGKVHKMVQEVNEFLLGISTTTPNITLMKNQNVRRNMLEGQRHINHDGFRLLLGNIRATLFNKTVQIINRSTYRSRESYGNHGNHGNYGNYGNYGNHYYP